MNYIDRPLRPYWQAVRDTMPGVTGARHLYTDWTGDHGERAIDIAIVLDWHVSEYADGARCSADTVELRVYRNGRSVAPSRVFSHLSELDAEFADYGSGSVAHYCPYPVVNAILASCERYLTK